MNFLFWSFTSVLIYTLLGYPILIGALTRLFSRRVTLRDSEVPPLRVSVVLVVFNAKHQIRGRLENLMVQDYRVDEIVVVCDGCNDGTPEEVTTFCDPRIKLISRPVRMGKSGCLNYGIQAATGEIVVLTDVRQEFRADAISRLVENFSDPQVGAVSGSLEIARAEDSISKGIGSYWSLEKELRRSEAVLDSCIGCTGAIYAIRRSLFTPIPPDTLLDDVVIPMQIALSGYRVAFDPRAIAFDPQPLSPERESVRKQRTLAGNFQLLFRYPGWLLPWRDRLWLQLISHKYLRLFAPLFLIIILCANCFLSGETFYRVLLILQTIFYFFSILGLFPLFRRIRLFSFASSFLFLNVMVVRGLGYYLFGKGDGIWENAPDARHKKKNPALGS